jgi:hypothetical protein
MLLAPLIIVVAGITRVTSRIEEGVGQEKRADNHRWRTPPRKIRARFLGFKHTSLVSVRAKLKKFGPLYSRTTFVTVVVTFGRR